jgi:hypothetical protein
MTTTGQIRGVVPAVPISPPLSLPRTDLRTSKRCVLIEVLS